MEKVRQPCLERSIVRKLRGMAAALDLDGRGEGPAAGKQLTATNQRPDVIREPRLAPGRTGLGLTYFSGLATWTQPSGPQSGLGNGVHWERCPSHPLDPTCVAGMEGSRRMMMMMMKKKKR